MSQALALRIAKTAADTAENLKEFKLDNSTYAPHIAAYTAACVVLGVGTDESLTITEVPGVRVLQVPVGSRLGVLALRTNTVHTPPIAIDATWLFVFVPTPNELKVWDKAEILFETMADQTDKEDRYGSAEMFFGGPSGYVVTVSPEIVEPARGGPPTYLGVELTAAIREETEERIRIIREHNKRIRDPTYALTPQKTEALEVA
jgi:hypothetical protein